MHKSLRRMAFALALLGPGTASAVHLNPDGLGQVLIYPFYTVEGGHQNLITVVNTRHEAKALKLRFLEARNGRDVASFNLYLGPHDVWTAALFALGASGPANLTTTDISCTVPGIRSGSLSLPLLPGSSQRFLPFSNAAYADSDAGPDRLERTRTGHLEVIEMGRFQTGSAFATALNAETPDCTLFENAWRSGGSAPLSGAFLRDASTDLLPPSGGLMGGAALVQVEDGSFYNYNAEAIADFSRLVLHTAAGEALPDLSSVNEGSAPTVRSNVAGENGLIESTWDRSTQAIDAISTLFMRSAAFNEFLVDPFLAARSEWIISLPTKRFYTDRARLSSDIAIAPFERSFPAEPANPVFDGSGTACDFVAMPRYNRRGDGIAINDFLGGAEVYSLCFSVNPYVFQRLPGPVSESTIFGWPPAAPQETRLWILAPTHRTVTGPTTVFEHGSIQLILHDPNFIGSSGGPQPVRHLGRPARDGDQYAGLPLIAAWLLKIENVSTRPGVAGFYGGLYPHRYTRVCINPTSCQTPN